MSIILIGTLLTLFLIPGYSLCSGKETPLTLIYTSNTLGEVESGCCPETGNAGGLARRSHFIKTVRNEPQHHLLLLLDGGDALVNGYFSRKSEREKARRRAEFVLKVYEKMGYDALNIGDTDVGLGVEYLKNLQKNSKVPFLSSNLKEKKNGKTIFKAFLIKEVDGLKVGIIGLVTPEIPPYLNTEMKGYFIENPIKVADETIGHSLSHCHHIIVLAHLSALEIESLAKGVPRISIIVGGNDRSFMSPRQMDHSVWVQTDPFGLHIGRLNLRLVKGSSEWIDISNAQKAQKEKKSLQAENRNAFQNFLTLLHPGMESDPAIEQLISSSRDQLKRPTP